MVFSDRESFKKGVEVKNYSLGKNIFYTGKCDQKLKIFEIIDLKMNGKGSRFNKTDPENELEYKGVFVDNFLKSGKLICKKYNYTGDFDN